MRAIKFRGKSIYNGRWVEGDLVRHYENQRRFIAQEQMAYTYSMCGIDRLVSERYCEIDPETIGQYTEINDKNGKEIYEGDIVECRDGECYMGMWEYDKRIVVDMRDHHNMHTIEQISSVEVIKNIYDNPELLEAQS